MINVQFSDSTEAVITGYFPEPQNPAIYPNQGTVMPTDARWSAYYATLPMPIPSDIPAPTTPAAPTLAQQAAALIAGGITITSTGTPALNGTYSTNAPAQENAVSVMSYINANAKFPGSAATMTWLDSSGNPHVFPSTTEFVAFFNAAMDFVMDCQMIVLTDEGALPEATATIP